MKSVKILDCTLRDGGYVNEWMFETKNIYSLVSKMVEAEMDIIECGFLSNKKKFSVDSSQFNTIKDLGLYLPKDRGKTKLIVMINFGEYIAADLPDRDKSSVDGLRVAFHKKDKQEALKFCREVKAKGYDLFMQPMVSLNYTDEEFLELISITNRLRPYAFYIVDSFGAMKTEDLLHYLYLIDYNLDYGINIGFHSHNNLQLSYSLAQTMVGHHTKKDKIIDASIMGMGRGAGNLNTELFAEYLNQIGGGGYKIQPLLQVMDKILSPVYQNKYWGYSLPHYLSAIHNCHPNYASYLDNKSTLTVENIDEIFNLMAPEKKVAFDREYIEAQYISYQSSKKLHTKVVKQLKDKFQNKNILIIAPGASIIDNKELIDAESKKNNTLSIAVNFKPDDFNCDFVFISNNRRWDSLQHREIKNLIVTSNINDKSDAAYIVDYSDLLNSEDAVKDNSAMMLIALLSKLGVKSILLAGIDGYAYDGTRNFVNSDLEFRKHEEIMDSMNKGMEKVLLKFSSMIPISFLPNLAVLILLSKY